VTCNYSCFVCEPIRGSVPSVPTENRHYSVNVLLPLLFLLRSAMYSPFPKVCATFLPFLEIIRPPTLLFRHISCNIAIVLNWYISTMCTHPKSNQRELTPAERAKIWTRYRDGYSVPKIIKLKGHPRGTVWATLKRYRYIPNSTFESKPRSGRPKKNLFSRRLSPFTSCKCRYKSNPLCACNSKQV
jgi:hypothetical protein